jgi:hypothetical protein
MSEAGSVALTCFHTISAFHVNPSVTNVRTILRFLLNSISHRQDTPLPTIPSRPSSLDPAAADLLRIHNHAMAWCESTRRAAEPPGRAEAGLAQAHPTPRQQEEGLRGPGRRRPDLGQRWRNTVGLARDLVAALRVSS